jgi:hypothetical protein
MTKQKAREHPVVSGRTTTFKLLGETLGISAANAAQKYYRIRADHGKVTMVQMQSPYRNPRVAKRVQTNLLARERQALVTHALQHGPTHTAMVHGVDPDYVQRLIAATKRKTRRS